MRSGCWKEPDTEEMLSLLKTKFGENSNPLDIFKNFHQKSWMKKRKLKGLKNYSSSKGSSKFQGTV